MAIVFHEDQNTELKRSISNFREASETACAFANAFGGKLIIGVSNDGKVFGVPDAELDSLQQRLEGAVQVVSPVPFRKISIETLDSKAIVVLEVFQIGQGSFCTYGGIVYYRSGSRTVKLEGRTLQDYIVKKRILSFDDAHCTAKLEDIDVEAVKAFLAKRSPDVPFEERRFADYLVSLGVAERNGKLSLKNAAVLFFGKDPSRFFPQNEVKLVRFKGVEAVNIIDSRYVSGTLLENLSRSMDFINLNTRTKVEINKLERTEVPEYPIAAVREALVNALIHRDYFSRDATQVSIYDDRMEITNPGTLPDKLSIALLGTLSVQRNPITYRLMRDMGMVEGLGTGVPRMRDSMRAAGLPEPQFLELGNFFRVTLFNRLPGKTVSELNSRQRHALAYLAKNPSLTSKKYEEIHGISHPTAVSDLNYLVKLGLVQKVGRTRGSFYVAKKSK